ncbi:MAG: PadR family transcriptional regulator [Actinomycetota bacterium]|nr:PadR family transcriptional regulator [Actinomycetota bacterium]
MTPGVPTFVVLGLLAKRPGSGYDIVAFAERSVSFFWPLSRSQLYTELSRLEELGWASGSTVEQDRYPNKRVYEPTPAGMTALREWLDAPAVPQKQRHRDPVVLKTFLGSFMSPDRLADQLEAHRQAAAQTRAKLLTVVSHLDSLEANASRRFGRATARYGVLQAEATMAWIDEVQDLMAAQAQLLALDDGSPE